MDKKTENGDTKKVMSPCDVEALKKCLEENKGDHSRCQTQVEAFKSSCYLKKQNPHPEPASNLRHDMEALKKCLEENKGDHSKCQTQVEAFKSSCPLKNQNSRPEPAMKLRRGAITDI